MQNKVCAFIIAVGIFAIAGCAPVQKERATHEPALNPHRLPFTEAVGDYYVRLVVNHVAGTMSLIFEDILHEPVMLRRLTKISGEVVLPDGTVKSETFHRLRRRYHRHLRRHYKYLKYLRRWRWRPGVYTARGAWVKTAPAFTLRITVPLKEQDYELTFHYEAPGGEIPSH